jgi:hypothetical protein
LFDIFLEGDSKQVVDAITDTGPMWCEFEHILGDTRELLKAFRRWEIIGQVKRTTNGAAHRLAKAAIREIGERIWLELRRRLQHHFLCCYPKETEFLLIKKKSNI